jgi:hypothetical protein
LRQEPDAEPDAEANANGQQRSCQRRKLQVQRNRRVCWRFQIVPAHLVKRRVRMPQNKGEQGLSMYKCYAFKNSRMLQRQA